MDGIHKTIDQAYDELGRRKVSSPGMFHRIEMSPYGGYLIVSIDADLYADMIADGIKLPTSGRRVSYESA